MRIIERDMLIEKIEEWRNKARRERDSFNQYLSIFIAYNIFYNLFKKTRDPSADLTYGDKFRAIEIVPLMDENRVFQSLKNDLSAYIDFIPIYRDEYWFKRDEVPINKQLEEAFERKDKRRTIEMLLKWLYKVRCNVVHGEKNYNDKQQRRLLQESSLLLEKVMQHALESYKQLYVHGEKKNLFSP